MHDLVPARQLFPGLDHHDLHGHSAEAGELAALFHTFASAWKRGLRVQRRYVDRAEALLAKFGSLCVRPDPEIPFVEASDLLPDAPAVVERTVLSR